MATSGGISPSHSGNERPAPSQWDAESDEKLMDARKSGLNWGPIASNYFPGKTANACRKRHERLQEKRQAADNWSGVKIEAMAKAYMDVREQMWKILADRVGEKWQTVETKVGVALLIYYESFKSDCPVSVWKRDLRTSKQSAEVPRGVELTRCPTMITDNPLMTPE